MFGNKDQHPTFLTQVLASRYEFALNMYLETREINAGKRKDVVSCHSGRGLVRRLPAASLACQGIERKMIASNRLAGNARLTTASRGFDIILCVWADRGHCSSVWWTVLAIGYWRLRLLPSLKFATPPWPPSRQLMPLSGSGAPGPSFDYHREQRCTCTASHVHY